MSLGFSGLMGMAQEEAKRQFGIDFNTEQTSNWYKMSASIIFALTYLEDKFLSLKAGRNIYTAQNTQLDDMFSNDLVFRIQGAKSTGKAIVTGSDNTDVPLNSIQVKGTNDLLYTNITEGKISGGTLTLQFECMELGVAGDLPVNNFSSVQKAPYGVRDVQNQQISGGLDIETDYEYIKRYLETIKDKDWSLPAILSAIRQLNGVISCDGVRNNTNTDGVNGIPKKSIKIVVDGGDETDIATTLYKRIHTPNTVGDIEKQIEMVPGQFETIRFSRPKTTTIDYQYVIISQDKEVILQLLKDYLNSTKVGDIISTEEFRKQKIYGYIKSNITVLSINFKKSTEADYKAFIQLNYDEKGSAGAGSEVSTL
ncbi:MAG: baseplate J/gp47 family protein [Cetobacterium sp.]